MGAGCWVLYCCCKGVEGGGEPLVEFVEGGGFRRGGTGQLLSEVDRFGQSASCQHGQGLSLWGDGGRKATNMRPWLDPVGERVNASHE